MHETFAPGVCRLLGCEGHTDDSRLIELTYVDFCVLRREQPLDTPQESFRSSNSQMRPLT